MRSDSSRWSLAVVGLTLCALGVNEVWPVRAVTAPTRENGLTAGRATSALAESRGAPSVSATRRLHGFEPVLDTILADAPISATATTRTAFAKGISASAFEVTPSQVAAAEASCSQAVAGTLLLGNPSRAAVTVRVTLRPQVRASSRFHAPLQTSPPLISAPRPSPSANATAPTAALPSAPTPRPRTASVTASGDPFPNSHHPAGPIITPRDTPRPRSSTSSTVTSRTVTRAAVSATEPPVRHGACQQSQRRHFFLPRRLFSASTPEDFVAVEAVAAADVVARQSLDGRDDSAFHDSTPRVPALPTPHSTCSVEISRSTGPRLRVWWDRALVVQPASGTLRMVSGADPSTAAQSPTLDSAALMALSDECSQTLQAVADWFERPHADPTARNSSRLWSWPPEVHVLITPSVRLMAREHPDLWAFVRASDFRGDLDRPWSNGVPVVYLAPDIPPERVTAVLIHEWTHIAQFWNCQNAAGGQPWLVEEWLAEGLAHAVEWDLGGPGPNLSDRLSAFATRPHQSPLLLASGTPSKGWRDPGSRGAMARFFHDLIPRYGREQAVDAWMSAAIADVHPPEDALAHALGTTWPELFRDWTIACHRATSDNAPAASISDAAHLLDKHQHGDDADRDAAAIPTRGSSSFEIQLAGSTSLPLRLPSALGQYDAEARTIRPENDAPETRAFHLVGPAVATRTAAASPQQPLVGWEWTIEWPAAAALQVTRILGNTSERLEAP